MEEQIKEEKKPKEKKINIYEHLDNIGSITGFLRKAYLKKYVDHVLTTKTEREWKKIIK